MAFARTQIKPRFAVGIAVCVYLVDVVLKQIALHYGGSGSGGVVEFALFLNKGLAFSLVLPVMAYWLAMILATLSLVWAFGVAFRSRPSMIPPLVFVAFGALSNLIDRVAIGATIDYLIFFGRSAVNLADGMIVGGLAWLVLSEAHRGRNKAGGEQGDR